LFPLPPCGWAPHPRAGPHASHTAAPPLSLPSPVPRCRQPPVPAIVGPAAAAARPRATHARTPLPPPPRGATIARPPGSLSPLGPKTSHRRPPSFFLLPCRPTAPKARHRLSIHSHCLPIHPHPRSAAPRSKCGCTTAAVHPLGEPLAAPLSHHSRPSPPSLSPWCKARALSSTTTVPASPSLTATVPRHVAPLPHRRAAIWVSPASDLLAQRTSPTAFMPAPPTPQHTSHRRAMAARATAPSPATVTAPARTRWAAEPAGSSCCWAVPTAVRLQQPTGRLAERPKPWAGFGPCVVSPLFFFRFI
jgi:hypothetical protein